MEHCSCGEPVAGRFVFYEEHTGEYVDLPMCLGHLEYYTDGFTRHKLPTAK